MTNRYLILPTLSDETHMSWFVFVVRLNDLFEPGDRDEIIAELRAEGIGCNNYFPPIHLQPYMVENSSASKPAISPSREYVSARTLALPFFTKMTTAQVDRVCERWKKFWKQFLSVRKGDSENKPRSSVFTRPRRRLRPDHHSQHQHRPACQVRRRSIHCRDRPSAARGRGRLWAKRPVKRFNVREK